MTSLGTVYLDVKFDQNQVGSDLKRTATVAGTEGAEAMAASFSTKAKGLSSQLSSAGKSLSLGITAPLVAAGAAATAAFRPFDENLSQITALAGVSAQQTKTWGTEILNTSARFGVLGQDAAKALYFISSSGIDASNAINVLNASMTGSQAGLGQVQTIADVATSAMNAYGAQNISAAQAVDILTVAVRDGKGEPEELAGSFSRVIPIAANLGVSFGQVAGAMSAMTLSGTSADEAATQLSGVLNTILSPSQEAADGLQAVGLSVTGLQQELRSNGLLPTLQTINHAFEGNSTAVAQVFGDVRALRGMLDLTGPKLAQTTKIIDDMSHAEGAAADAAKVMAESTSGKLAQATAQLNNDLIEIGGNVTPAIASIVGVVGSAASAFGKLPAPVQTTTVGLLGVAAATGPVLYGASQLSKAAGAVGSGLEAVRPALASFLLASKLNGGGISGMAKAAHDFTSSLSPMAQGIGAAGILAAGAAASFAIWSNRMADAQKNADALGSIANKMAGKGGIGAAEEAIRKNQQAIADLTAETDDSKAPWDKDYRDELGKYEDQLKATNDQTQAQIDAARKLADATGTNADAAFEWIRAQSAAGNVDLKNLDDLKGKFEAATNAQDPLATKMLGTQHSMQGLMAATGTLDKAFFDLIGSQRSLEDAGRKIEDAQRAQLTAGRNLTQANRDVASAQRGVTEAERQRAEASLKVRDAVQAQQDAQQRLNDLLNGNAGKSDQLDVESAQLSLDDARRRLAKGDFDRTDPNARKRAELDVQRAEIELARAQEAHGKNVQQAQKDLQSASQAVSDAQHDEQQSILAIGDAQRQVEDATHRREDAERAVGDAVRDTQRAQEDAVSAADQLAQKQQAFTGALAGANGLAPQFIDYLNKLKDLYPQVGDSIQQAIDKFQAEQAGKVLTPDQASALGFLGAAQSGTLGHRANGGPVTAGSLYEVNEGGLPEMLEQGGHQYLLPLEDGYVHSSASMLRAISDVRGAAGAGGGTNFYGGMTIVSPSPGRTAHALKQQLRKKAYLAGGK